MFSRNSGEPSDTPLHTKIEQMLTEAHVVLPGAQALFGFQLAIVLTQSFEQLPHTSRMTHATAIFLVALAVVLLMAPAAYHRIVYAGEDTQDMYRVDSALVKFSFNASRAFAALQDRGWRVNRLSLSSDFPFPDDHALAAADAALGTLPDEFAQQSSRNAILFGGCGNLEHARQVRAAGSPPMGWGAYRRRCHCMETSTIFTRNETGSGTAKEERPSAAFGATFRTLGVDQPL